MADEPAEGREPDPHGSAEGLCTSWMPRVMIWELSDRYDPPARRIADRHYNRQKPGSNQFVPPGRCLVLKTADAVWVTSWPFAQYVKHAWPGAWVNSCFRREGGDTLASEMIRQAVAATLWRWPEPPALGLVTFVDRAKTRAKRDPGFCYLMAGFQRVGETKGGLVALQLLPSEMPDAMEPIGAQGTLAVAGSGRGGPT